MKLLQAIVTSCVETLDNRQGFGMVKCSRVLPEPIKQQARDWGLSPDAGGNSIFSLKHIEVSGVRWAAMNRTVPATDFTGRTSYVSHTIALRLVDLQQWCAKHHGNLVSPFEFMLHFPWKDAWDAKPTWIEGGEDMEIGENIADDLLASCLHEKPVPSECSPSAYLLAFDHQETSKPKPKRLSWNTGTSQPADTLRFFHQAWITLDPWRGGKNYGDYLNEPDVSLAESWDCTFTTNLRNERPDPYQWVALTDGSSKLGNRTNINLIDWQNLDEQDVIREIGEPYGSILVARSKNPQEWANYEIRNIMDRHIEAQHQEFNRAVREIEAKVDEVIHNGEDYLSECKNTYAQLEGQLTNQGHGSKEIGVFEEYIRGEQKKIADAISQIRSNHVDQSKQLSEAIAPMKEILRSQTGQEFTDQSYPFPTPPDLTEKRNDFDALAEKIRLSYLYGDALGRESSLIKEKQDQAASVAKLEMDLKTLNDKTAQLLAKDQKNEGEIARLKTTASPRQRQSAWQLPTLIGVAVLSLALGFLIFIKRDKLFNDSYQPDIFKQTQAELNRKEIEALSQGVKLIEAENRLLETKGKLETKEREVRSRVDSISSLEADKKTIQADLENLKTLNKNVDSDNRALREKTNELNSQLIKKDQEIGSLKKSLIEKPTVAHNTKKDNRTEGDAPKDKKKDTPPEGAPKLDGSPPPSGADSSGEHPEGAIKEGTPVGDPGKKGN